MQMIEQHATGDGRPGEDRPVTPAERLAASRPARARGPKPGVVRGPLKPPPGRKPPCFECGVVNERRRLAVDAGALDDRGPGFTRAA